MKEKVIDTGIYWIKITNNGIFRIHKNSKRRKEMLSGKFRIVKYIPEFDSFIIKIKRTYFYGSVDKLLKFSWSFRYKGSAPVLRFIFESYKKEKRKGVYIITNKLKFGKDGFLIPQKITCKIYNDEEITDLIKNTKKEKGNEE